MSKTAAKTTFVMLHSEHLQIQLNEEQSALDTTNEALTRLQHERKALLLDDDDDAKLAKHDEAIASAKRARDRHAARVEKLEREHEDAAAAEAEAERLHQQRKRWAERKAIIQAGHAAMARYPSLCQELVEVVLAIKAGDELIERANADRPVDEGSLSSPSSARGTPPVEERVETYDELIWVDSGSGRPLGAAMLNEAGVPNVPARRAVVTRERIIPFTPAWNPLPLWEKLGELPGMRRGERFWPK